MRPRSQPSRKGSLTSVRAEQRSLLPGRGPVGWPAPHTHTHTGTQMHTRTLTDKACALAHRTHAQPCKAGTRGLTSSRNLGRIFCRTKDPFGGISCHFLTAPPSRQARLWLRMHSTSVLPHVLGILPGSMLTALGRLRSCRHSDVKSHHACCCEPLFLSLDGSQRTAHTSL